MKLPLYKQAKSNINRVELNLNDNNINIGLYYQKFCNTWKGKFNNLDKKSFINKSEEKSRNFDKSLLEENIERMCYLVQGLGGSFKIYELEERFITGTGLDHPVGIGFLWDYRLGLPYIAGSSIKGVIKNWIKIWGAAERDDIKRIFGSDNEKKENKIGSVIFFDALPYKTIKLQTDIITPHFSSYYNEGKCPGDWSNPTPISFLTIDKNQKFIFFIAPRRKEYIEDCKQVINWLDDVITTLGAGAKTATGYGRFKSLEREEKVLNEKLKSKIKEAKRKREIKNMSPVRRQMEEDGYNQDGDIFMKNLTIKWLEYLRGDTDQKIKVEIAIYLAEWYKTNRHKQWKKPKGKNIEKVNLIKSFLD